MTTKNHDELNSALENDLRQLSPEQFKQVSEVVGKVQRSQVSQADVNRRVANMSDAEFDRLKDSWGC